MAEFLPMRKACELAGGITALARLLNVSPQLIHRWASGQQEIPHIRCVQIKKLTNGAVTRQMLRPDDWHEMWPELQAPTAES